MPPERLATDAEMQATEQEAARMARAFFDAYLVFPTADNFDATLSKMREFQACWMNGRVRPL